MAIKKVIQWFRQDLRIADNPAFSAAAKAGSLLPLYIFDDLNSVHKPMGAASRCWLHHSLESLHEGLENHLMIQSGDPLPILKKLVKEHNIDAIYWNRCYEPWQIKRDTKIKAELKAMGVEVRTFNSALLWEPWEVEKKSGGNYKVFTPFYRKGCLQGIPPRKVIRAPSNVSYIHSTGFKKKLGSLELIPALAWPGTMMNNWKVGESAAKKRLQAFIRSGLSDYKEGRNFPAEEYVSCLSPHLHWGEISPHQIWDAIKKLKQDANTDCFLSELGWREFSYSLLYYYPMLPTKNLQKKFDAFPWRKSKKLLEAWQQGQTGYPIIDAGMRELWQTGYMHNRVRMVVASFLIKNLMIHWHEGEKWFWDCLVDADLASNSASWQWVAGCGADAAPFFRIFNPVTQGKKFDSEGAYTKHYVPELAELPAKYLHAPWEAPENVLEAAGITLGKTYPKPIIDLRQSRQQALDAYKNLR